MAVEIREVPVAQTRALRQAVLRPHNTQAELVAHEPERAFALGTFERGELVAVGLIGPEGEPGSWRIRGMATAPAARGRGAGTALLAGLIDHARSRGATRIWCNARTPARTLYERAGLSVVSEEFELPAIGPHYLMELRVLGHG